MKTVYIVVDKETWTNVAAAFTKEKVLEETLGQDVYFATEDEFYEKFTTRYDIEVMKIEEEEKWNINMEI